MQRHWFVLTCRAQLGSDSVAQQLTHAQPSNRQELQSPMQHPKKVLYAETRNKLHYDIR